MLLGGSTEEDQVELGAVGPVELRGRHDLDLPAGGRQRVPDGARDGLRVAEPRIDHHQCSHDDGMVARHGDVRECRMPGRRVPDGGREEPDRAVVDRCAGRAPPRLRGLGRYSSAFAAAAAIVIRSLGKKPMTIVATAAMVSPARSSNPPASGGACSGGSRMYM